MSIFELSLIRKREGMIRDGIRLDAIGDLSRMPPEVPQAFHHTTQATEHSTKSKLGLALNYGSRAEKRRAILKIVHEHETGRLHRDEITEEYIARCLDTRPWGDPDLLIRTSGELRLSNFLLWQVSYSEIYVTDVLWPDFSARHIFEAVLAFQERTRRHGGS